MLLAPTFDIINLTWLPVGPFDDPYTHLMAPCNFGDCPMAIHAVEVMFNRDNMLVAKSDMLKHILLGVKMIAGDGTYHRITMDGRSYLLLAMPCPSSEIPPYHQGKPFLDRQNQT